MNLFQRFISELIMIVGWLVVDDCWQCCVERLCVWWWYWRLGWTSQSQVTSPPTLSPASQQQQQQQILQITTTTNNDERMWTLMMINKLTWLHCSKYKVSQPHHDNLLLQWPQELSSSSSTSSSISSSSILHRTPEPEVNKSRVKHAESHYQALFGIHH